MIKALVFDMDGTLLNSKNQISPKTREALIEAQKDGVKIILASGRSYARLLKYARELKMDHFGGLLIEVDGMYEYSVQDGRRIKLSSFPLEDVKEVMTFLMGKNCESMAVFDEGLFDYTPEPLLKMKEQMRIEQGLPEDFPLTGGPWSWLADMRDGYKDITFIKDADEINGTINKIQVMQDEDKIGEIYQDLVSEFQDRFTIYRTTPRQLEVIPLSASKGLGLRSIRHSNDWSRSEVAAFGDGENDVSMFEEVKFSYAMENAPDFVQKQALFKTGHHDRDGIVQAIEEMRTAGLIGEKKDKSNGTGKSNKRKADHSSVSGSARSKRSDRTDHSGGY